MTRSLRSEQITLPFDTLPLRSNDRMHWARKAKITKQIRDAAHLVGMRAAQFETPVTVTLVWQVTDRRRRDVGAGAPTLKAAIDGLVDACVLVDDSAAHVVEERYRIEVGDRRGVLVEIAEVAR